MNVKIEGNKMGIVFLIILTCIILLPFLEAFNYFENRRYQKRILEEALANSNKEKGND